MSAMISRVMMEATAAPNQQTGSRRLGMFRRHWQPSAGEQEDVNKTLVATDPVSRDLKHWDEISRQSKTQRLLACLRAFLACLEQMQSIQRMVEPGVSE